MFYEDKFEDLDSLIEKDMLDVMREAHRGFKEDLLGKELSGRILARESEVFDYLASHILSVRYWVAGGAVSNDDIKRMEEEYLSGLALGRNIVDGAANLTDALNKYTLYQAKINWVSRMMRGAGYISSEKEQLEDYENAKRYIGFLISNYLVEACGKKESSIHDCFEVLQEEYFQYLVSLSVEDFVRIKAFLKWRGCHNRIENDDKSRMEWDYYQALNTIHRSMVNCKNRTSSEFLANSSSLSKVKVFMDQCVGSQDLIAIKQKSLLRLQASEPRQVDQYVQALYFAVDQAMAEKKLQHSDLDLLIYYLFLDYHVPSMLELFLRCFFCTYFPDQGVKDIINKKEPKRSQGMARPQSSSYIFA